jgi:enoyl-CoA hydratase
MSTTMNESVLVQCDQRVATVTINRPAVRNALNSATLSELASVLRQLRQDSDIRVVIVTGAGDKAFIAGADIAELRSLTPETAREFVLSGQAVFDTIETLGKPVIAAINGWALGGGCELALACTLRIAAETAKLGLPEITLGIMPGYGGSQRLARIVGKGRALELMLTGSPIGATEAQQIGLVNRVTPAADLMTETRTLAETLASRAPIAAHHIIEAVNQGLDMPQRDACKLEATLFSTLLATADTQEGIAAFLEKRKAVFSGR